MPHLHRQWHQWQPANDVAKTHHTKKMMPCSCNNVNDDNNLLVLKGTFFPFFAKSWTCCCCITWCLLASSVLWQQWGGNDAPSSKDDNALIMDDNLNKEDDLLNLQLLMLPHPTRVVTPPCLTIQKCWWRKPSACFFPRFLFSSFTTFGLSDAQQHCLALFSSPCHHQTVFFHVFLNHFSWIIKHCELHCSQSMVVFHWSAIWMAVEQWHGPSLHHHIGGVKCWIGDHEFCLCGKTRDTTPGKSHQAKRWTIFPLCSNKKCTNDANWKKVQINGCFNNWESVELGTFDEFPICKTLFIWVMQIGNILSPVKTSERRWSKSQQWEELWRTMFCNASLITQELFEGKLKWRTAKSSIEISEDRFPASAFPWKYWLFNCISESSNHAMKICKISKVFWFIHCFVGVTNFSAC